MFAKEASSTQPSLCWAGGDDVLQFSPNFEEKGAVMEVPNRIQSL